MAVEISNFPLAYFLTWTTYGTWLPGDDRGWNERGKGLQLPDRYRMFQAALRMKEDAILLDTHQRRAVEETIRRHCSIRRWHLHAVNCRTNHVHVVFTGPVDPEVARDQFKAYCTRDLKRLDPNTRRERWWTERGKCDWINDETGLEAAILYVLEAQDRMDRDY